MLTDAQLTQLIGSSMKAEVAELHPPADLVARLRPEVRRSWRPSAGGIVAGLASLAAVAIAVLAITLPKHHQPAPAKPAALPASARAVVAKLAVLRRAQTAADRSLRLSGQFRSWRLVPSLTRLLGVITVRPYRQVRVYLVVRSLPGTRRYRALAVGAGNRGSELVLAVAWPSPGPELPPVSQRGPVDANIVPDGVARVKWSFSATRASGLKTITVSPPVANNFAWAPRSPGQSLLATTTWYAADGHVIASENFAAQRARQQRTDARAISASDKRPIAPSLLEHFALFRNPKTAAESLPMPEDIAAQYARQPGGLNVGDARFVRVPETEPPVRGYPHGVWVIPGTDGLCDMDTQEAGGCNGLTGKGSPDAGGYRGTSTGDGIEWVGGIVPDGNPTVTLLLVNGTRRTVPVVDNVYSVAIKGTRAVTLIVRDSTGRRVTFSVP